MALATYEDIPKAFVEGMSELCKLHPTTGVGESGEYLTPDIDKQVGLGMLGLANLLRIYGVKYSDFGQALKDINEEKVNFTPAHNLAKAIQNGVQAASKVAESHDMVRAFAVAPTASCSYRSKDRQKGSPAVLR